MGGPGRWRRGPQCRRGRAMSAEERGLRRGQAPYGRRAWLPRCRRSRKRHMRKRRNLAARPGSSRREQARRRAGKRERTGDGAPPRRKAGRYCGRVPRRSPQRDLVMIAVRLPTSKTTRRFALGTATSTLADELGPPENENHLYEAWLVERQKSPCREAGWRFGTPDVDMELSAGPPWRRRQKRAAGSRVWTAP